MKEFHPKPENTSVRTRQITIFAMTKASFQSGGASVSYGLYVVLLVVRYKIGPGIASSKRRKEWLES
jgi:hypothetical protein